MTIQQALQKYFGLKTFRNAQQEIIESIIDGNNVLAVLPTGAGKSLCYQLPALISENFSIVISPLISLMKDQVDALNNNNRLEDRSEELAAFINSTMTFYETEEVLRNIEFGKIKLLYVAPERLGNNSFAERIKKLSPTYLFIDEAHCISEWGHNFRPSYSKIKEFIDFVEIKNVSGFTATATPEVIKDITKQLGFKNHKLFVKGFERDNLHLNVIITKKKKEKCLELISVYKTPAIIYTASRKNAEEISEFLVMNRINCSYYHAGVQPEIRKKIQEDFIEDRTPIIAATNAFGMGIDKKDIRLIIHYNTPGSIENYYQEIGRAGRDGKSSHVFLLHEDYDINIQNFFISNSYPDKELIQNIYSAICDYGKIAEGVLPENEIPLNMEYINAYCKKKISKGLLHAALRFLESANYLKQLSEYERNISLQFIMNKNRLKEFTKQSSNDLLKETVLQLLREFGSEILSGKINISISQLSKKFDLDEDNLEETLLTLDNLGVLSFNKIFSKDNIILTSPRVSKNQLIINYKKINESYLNLRSKVDRMVNYVYSLDCRFKFILHYFGEDVSGYQCGRCDRCTAKQGLSADTVNYVKEIILKTLGENNFKFTENSLIQLLRGKSKKTELAGVSSFGAFSNYASNDLKLIIHQMISEKSLIKRIGKTGALSLSTEAAAKFKIPNQTESDILFLDYEENLILFNTLREVRTKAAKRFMQSSYLICADEILRIIAAKKPKTKNELLSIEGFNNRMFNKIGEEILEAINEMQNEEIFSNETKNSSTKDLQKEIPQNIIETFHLLKKGYGLKDIASLRKLSEPIISMQIETIIEFKPEVDVSHLFNDGIYDLIMGEIKKGFSNLKEIKATLPNEISFSQIRIAAAKYRTSVTKRY